MLDLLSTGAGLCTPSHQLVLRPTSGVVETGAMMDFIRPMFQAVHRTNRHAPEGDFLAIALPFARRGVDRKRDEITAGKRGLADFGDLIEVFGTEAALARLTEDGAVALMVRRGLISPRLRVREVSFSPGETGVALVRSQSLSARMDGAKRRQQARDLRRAQHIAATRGTHGSWEAEGASSSRPEKRDLFLCIREGVTLDLIVRHGPARLDPVRVNTYGVSTLSAPAFLPSAPPSEAMDG